MVKRLLTVLLSSVSAAVAAANFAQRYELWEEAPLGIAVTRCDYSTCGVHVRFETDIEPPYVVGVYRPSEEGLGRRTPVSEVETTAKEVFLPGNFTDVALFVQVMSKDVADRYAADEIGRHVMTRTEWHEYVETIRNAAPFANHDAGGTFETDAANRMDLVGDFTWAGFVKTADTNLNFTLRGRKAEPDIDSVVTNVVQDVMSTNISTSVSRDGTVEYVRTNSSAYATTSLSMVERHSVFTNDYAGGGYFAQEIFHHPMHNDHEACTTNYLKHSHHMVPHEYSFSIADGRNDVGTGYRIMMFEDTGVCQAQRAYSARTNMSDVVVLPAGFRALSSHNGYIYTTDWEGRRHFQRVTNRVDHVIGGRR